MAAAEGAGLRPPAGVAASPPVAAGVPSGRGAAGRRVGAASGRAGFGRAGIGGAAFAAALALSAGAAPAADAAGRYAVDGLGLARCADFLAARRDDRVAEAGYGGWVAGYFTAFNRLNPDTYDLTPWQSVELLLAKLAAFCEGAPEVPFVEAATLLAAVLEPDRLTTESRTARVAAPAGAVLQYEAVLIRVQAALRARGFEDRDYAGFDPALSAALRAFQAAEGLPETGLPDLPTLVALLDAPAR